MFSVCSFVTYNQQENGLLNLRIQEWIKEGPERAECWKIARTYRENVLESQLCCSSKAKYTRIDLADLINV